MSRSASFWVRWRVPLAYPFALAGFWFARPTRMSLAEGAGLALLGLIVRAVAAGVVRKGEQLAVSGIYAWTRNPLYLGSTILAAGFAVAAHSWLVVGVVAAYIVLFYPAVIRREERDLRQRFGPEFDAYRSRVPVFLPWPTRQPSGFPGFSWAIYKRNHEFRAAIGALAAMGILVLRMWLRS